MYNLFSKPKNVSFPKDYNSTFNSDDDDRDRFPFPYIFNHPRPPDDLAPSAQVRVITPSKDENKVNCQYYGKELTIDGQFSHSCNKKPE